MKTIKIAHLYYDLMNLYGENGNIRFLKKRLEDQGVSVEVHFLTIDDDIDFSKYDFIYMGTGSEENQLIVLDDLKKYKNELKKIVKDKFVLLTGNALELFGKEIVFKDGTKINALNVFDYTIKEEEFRIVGEQYYSSSLIDNNIVGFQNRACSMSEVDDYLFEVSQGCGFNPNINKEGFKINNCYGTYLLGPILVRNPYLCDYIIKELLNSMKIKYNNPNYDDYAYKAYDELIKNFYTN